MKQWRKKIKEKIRMIIKLLNIYNDKPYYTIICKDGTYNALGYEQVKRFIDEAKNKKEKIEIERIDKLLNEHNKLIELI